LPVRLLFDENLSEQLVDLLADLFPDSLHIRTLRGPGASDLTVWQLAADQGCILVTKDEDFQRLSISRGAPPKVIWIRLGNCTTKQLAELFRSRFEVIDGFEAHEEATFLALA
jgi:predicted nuclease of predicted toxin-antitoxin system